MVETLETSLAGDEAARKEEAIRAQYRLILEQKVMLQVNAIKEKEQQAKEKQIQAQRDQHEKQAKQEALKAQIAQELTKIKQLEMPASRQSVAAHLPANIVLSSPSSIMLAQSSSPAMDTLEHLRNHREEESKRLACEAKVAVERIRKAGEQREKQKRHEAEEARQRAIQAELQRLMAEEELEKEENLRRDKARREEKERKIAQDVLERRQKEEAEQREQRRAYEDEKLRETELLKKTIAQARMNKFKSVEHGAVSDHDSTAAQRRPKRLDAPQHRSIVTRFESKAQASEVQEAMIQAQIESKRKKRPWRSMRDKMRQSVTKLHRIVSNQPVLDVPQPINPEPGATRVASPDGQPSENSKSRMKNYLLAQVLFDGEEEVHASSRVNLQKPTGWAAESEIIQNEKAFQRFREDMETYLALFDPLNEPPNLRQSDRHKRTKEIVRLSDKPIHNIGNIMDRFESFEVEPNQRPLTNTKVGKLALAETIFNTQVDPARGGEDHSRQARHYVPVVIDKEAFARTMSKFEMYNQEEEERETQRRRKRFEAAPSKREAQLSGEEILSEPSKVEPRPGLGTADSGTDSDEDTDDKDSPDTMSDDPPTPENLVPPPAQPRVSEEMWAIARVERSEPGHEAFQETINSILALIDETDYATTNQGRGKPKTGRAKRPGKLSSSQLDLMKCSAQSHEANPKSSPLVGLQIAPAKVRTIRSHLFKKASVNLTQEQPKEPAHPTIAPQASCRKIKLSLLKRISQASHAQKLPKQPTQKVHLIQMPQEVANMSQPSNTRPSTRTWSYQQKNMKDLHELVHGRRDELSVAIARQAKDILKQTERVHVKQDCLEALEEVGEEKGIISSHLSNVSDQAELARRHGEIQKLTEQRDQEFKDFMEHLQSTIKACHSSQAEDPNGSSEVIGETKSKRNGAWPKLDAVPWKLSNLKNRYMQASRDTDHARKMARSSAEPRGKLANPPFVSGGTSEAEGPKPKAKLDCRAEFISHGKLKSKYENERKKLDVPTLRRAPKVKIRKGPGDGEDLDGFRIRRRELSDASVHLTKSLKPRPQSTIDYPRHRDLEALKGKAPSGPRLESWQHMEDPEVRKSAILVKHGFKSSREVKAEKDINWEDLGTIPRHILNDEVLYRAYMNHQIEAECSQVLAANHSIDQNEGSIRVGKPSSQRNSGHLNSVPKRTEKGIQSRKVEETQWIVPQDMSQVPGSCWNLKHKFEAASTQAKPTLSATRPARDSRVPAASNIKHYKKFWDTLVFPAQTLSKENIEAVQPRAKSQGQVLKRFHSAIQLPTKDKMDLVKKFFKNETPQPQAIRTKGPHSELKERSPRGSVSTRPMSRQNIGWNDKPDLVMRKKAESASVGNLGQVRDICDQWNFSQGAMEENDSLSYMDTELRAIREMRLLRPDDLMDATDGSQTQRRQVSDTELVGLRELGSARRADIERSEHFCPTSRAEHPKIGRLVHGQSTPNLPTLAIQRGQVERELAALRQLRAQHHVVFEEDSKMHCHNDKLKLELDTIKALRQEAHFETSCRPQTDHHREIVQRELSALNYARKHLLAQPDLETSPLCHGNEQQDTIQRELGALRILQKLAVFASDETKPRLELNGVTNWAVRREMDMIAHARRVGFMASKKHDHTTLQEGSGQRSTFDPGHTRPRRAVSYQELDVRGWAGTSDQREQVRLELEQVPSLRALKTEEDSPIHPLGQDHGRIERLMEMASLRQMRNNNRGIGKVSQDELRVTERQRLDHELTEIRALRRSQSCEITQNRGSDDWQGQQDHRHRWERNRLCNVPKQAEVDNARASTVSGREAIELELQELRELRRNSSLSRVQNGEPRSNLGSITRSASMANVGSQSGPSVDTSSRTNATIKAWFESQAPKYKFGGDGSSRLSLAGSFQASHSGHPRVETKTRVQPGHRDRVDQRQWVHETVNKYFKVIIEESDEDVVGSSNEDNTEVVYPDTEEEEAEERSARQPGRSSSQLRSMFHSTLKRVSSQIGSSQEILIDRFRNALTSQLGLDS